MGRARNVYLQARDDDEFPVIGLRICPMRYALCELMRFAQWFGKTKSFAAFEDELIACE
jgi:hypothetical protein